MLISQATYPGVGPVDAADYECPQGIGPGRATLVVPAPVGTLDPVGDLAFSDGTNTYTVARCRVASVTWQGGSGVLPTATILLEDGRWEWAFGKISGRYNVPAEYTNTVALVTFPGQAAFGNQNYAQVPIPPNELPIRPETAKTAQELATLCLKAMKVPAYDVSALDPTSYPSVEWDAETPAVALQALAERYGCRVTFNPATRFVRVAKEGVGSPLPDGPLLFDSPSLTPKPAPKTVRVLSDFTKYQMRFALEMMLPEFDGGWRPADQVSYRPTNGWTGIGPGAGSLTVDQLPNLPGARTQFDAIAQAGAYLYKVYRVALTRADGKGVLRVPADGGETDRCDFHKQVYLLPNKAQVTRDDLNRHSPAPAQCFGRHTRLHACGVRNPITLYEDTTAETEVVVPFSIDAEHALVLFALPVYAFKVVPAADGGDGVRRACYPADIVLETACHFAPKGNADQPWQFRRREFSRDIPGGLSELSHYVVRGELFATSVASYQAGTNTLDTVDTNDDDLQGRADYYLDGEVLKLVPDAAETRTYSGVVPLAPDGAIRQVSVAMAAGDRNKPATTASSNTEHSVYLPDYQGRRLREEADLRPAARTSDRLAALRRHFAGDGAGGVPG